MCVVDSPRSSDVIFYEPTAHVDPPVHTSLSLDAPPGRSPLFLTLSLSSFPSVPRRLSSLQAVVDNIQSLLGCLRRCNTTLRWLLLHRRTTNKKFRELIVTEDPRSEDILDLLLHTAQFEFKLKKIIADLLATKQESWAASKEDTRSRISKLADFYGGNAALEVVEADSSLQVWLNTIAASIEAIEYGNSTLAGRQIQSIIAALEEVEQFEAIDSNWQVKQFLDECRKQLLQMVRLVNVSEMTMSTIDVISDISYAFDIINDFMTIIHRVSVL